jgi:hypothetical protein
VKAIATMWVSYSLQKLDNLPDGRSRFFAITANMHNLFGSVRCDRFPQGLDARSSPAVLRKSYARAGLPASLSAAERRGRN